MKRFRVFNIIYCGETKTRSARVRIKDLVLEGTISLNLSTKEKPKDIIRIADKFLESKGIFINGYSDLRYDLDKFIK